MRLQLLWPSLMLKQDLWAKTQFQSNNVLFFDRTDPHPSQRKQLPFQLFAYTYLAAFAVFDSIVLADVQVFLYLLVECKQIFKLSNFIDGFTFKKYKYFAKM